MSCEFESWISSYNQSFPETMVADFFEENKFDGKKFMGKKVAGEKPTCEGYQQDLLNNTVKQIITSSGDHTSFFEKPKQFAKGKYCPLHYACAMRLPEVVHALLANGADVNYAEKHESWMTPLAYALLGFDSESAIGSSKINLEEIKKYTALIKTLEVLESFNVRKKIGRSMYVIIMIRSFQKFDRRRYKAIDLFLNSLSLSNSDDSDDESDYDFDDDSVSNDDSDDDDSDDDDDSVSNDDSDDDDDSISNDDDDSVSNHVSDPILTCDGKEKDMFVSNDLCDPILTSDKKEKDHDDSDSDDDLDKKEIRDIFSNSHFNSDLYHNEKGFLVENANFDHSNLTVAQMLKLKPLDFITVMSRLHNEHKNQVVADYHLCEKFDLEHFLLSDICKFDGYSFLGLSDSIDSMRTKLEKKMFEENARTQKSEN